MNFNRRRLFAALAGVASATAATSPALARNPRGMHYMLDSDPAPTPNSTANRDIAPRTAIDGASLGLRPNAAEDQTSAFQRAIDRAAAARAVLHVTPGFYRAGGLHLPSYAAIAGVRGATRIVLSGGTSIFTASGSDHINISGLVLDGSDIPVVQQHGLVELSQSRATRVTDCEIVNAGGNGITFTGVEGDITGNTVSAANNAIFSLDARGLRIADNTVRGAGNGGILVWRTTPGDDGTLVVNNRIEGVTSKTGGTGQYGNGINVFRANNVTVRGNRIHNTAFSAVRGNSASNLQIVGNTCTSLGEVALYSEFAFEGAIIANNIVDGAAVGVSVTNSNQGGRLAVVQGNLIRNLVRGRPPGNDQSDTRALGIGIEADTVASGNVIENVQGVGIAVGWGPYLRDVAVTANVVRGTDIGIAVSVVAGAGAAVIADNLISEARQGAIVGTEWKNPVTGDLSKDGTARYAQLSIGGNQVR